MAFTFGGINALYAIAAVLVGVTAIAFIAKYLGLGEFLNTLLNAIGHFFNILGRILSFAPSWLKVGFFLIMAVFSLGLVMNWFVAADVVCANSNPYEAPSLMQSVFAKSLSSDGETQSSLLQFVVNPFASVASFQKFGTFLTVAGDTDVQPAVNANWTGLEILAVESGLNASDNGALLISKDGIFSLTQKKTGIAICQPNTLSLFTGIESFDGDTDKTQCYMHMTPWVSDLSNNCGFENEIATGSYAFVTVQGASGVETKLDIILNSNQDNWNMCGQGAGTILLKSKEIQKFTQEDGTVSIINLTGYQGWIHAKYVTLNDLKVSDIVSSSRSAFVTDSDSGFSKINNVGRTITYACDKNDDVQVGLYGMQVFNFTSLLVLIAIGGFLAMMKGLGLF